MIQSVSKDIFETRFVFTSFDAMHPDLHLDLDLDLDLGSGVGKGRAVCTGGGMKAYNGAPPPCLGSGLPQPTRLKQ